MLRSKETEMYGTSESGYLPIDFQLLCRASAADSISMLFQLHASPYCPLKNPGFNFLKSRTLYHISS